MGGLGGNVGWASSSGGYAYAFLTGSVGGFEHSDSVEDAARGVLGLQPL